MNEYHIYCNYNENWQETARKTAILVQRGFIKNAVFGSKTGPALVVDVRGLAWHVVEDYVQDLVPNAVEFYALPLHDLAYTPIGYFHL